MSNLGHAETKNPIVSLRLWRSLYRVPRYHPLADAMRFKRYYISVGMLWGALVTILFLLIFILPGLILLPLMYFFVNVTLNCITWTANVAHTIARQRANGTYDLLCLLPDGAVQLNWLICAEALHHKGLLRRAYADAMVLTQAVGAIPVIALVSLILLSDDSSAHLTAIVWLAFVLAIIIALIMDYAQSVVMACLVGAVVGNYVKTPREARVWAMLVTVAAQMAFYALLGAMVALMVWYYIAMYYQQSTPSVFWIGMLAPVASVMIYAALREIVNRVLLWMLARMLNGEADEFKHHSFFVG